MPSAPPPPLLPVPPLGQPREQLRSSSRSGKSYALVETMRICAHVLIDAVGGVSSLGFLQRAKSARASLH